MLYFVNSTLQAASLHHILFLLHITEEKLNSKSSSYSNPIPPLNLYLPQPMFPLQMPKRRIHALVMYFVSPIPLPSNPRVKMKGISTILVIAVLAVWGVNFEAVMP
jgi:hypothetical protein